MCVYSEKIHFREKEYLYMAGLLLSNYQMTVITKSG